MSHLQGGLNDGVGKYQKVSVKPKIDIVETEKTKYTGHIAKIAPENYLANNPRNGRNLTRRNRSRSNA